MLTPQNLIDNIGQSLTGLDAPYGDFNFFTRPPRWSMSAHRHPFYQFLLVIAGELSLAAGSGEPETLSRGMVSLIPPEITHSLKSKDGYRQFGINLMADPPQEDARASNALVKILTTYVTSPAVINIPMLLDLLPEIEDCSRLQTMVSVQKIRNRLEYMLLACVDILKRQDGGQSFKEKLMAYLRENLSEDLSLDDISRALVMSPTHAERLSYMEFGCGAIRLFHRLKIDRARALLITTDLPITVISSHLGYQDLSYFSRIFKKYSGTSPRAYKKNRR